MDHQILLSLGAILSGVCFSFIGIAYGFGNLRQIPPVYLVVIMGLCGSAAFGFSLHGVAWQQVPKAVWIWGIIAGASQFACVLLFKSALAQGPLSPVWCAISLNFVLPIIYAGLFFNEIPSGLQASGILLGIGGVFTGAWGQQKKSGGGLRSSSVRSFIRYGAVLLVIFLVNSLLNIGIKQLSVMPDTSAANYMTLHGNFYFFMMYTSLSLLTLAYVVCGNISAFFTVRTIGLGLMAAAGSISGMWLLGRCAALPSFILFPLNSITSIVCAGIVSLLLFKERFSWQWLLMILGMVLAIVLVNLRL